MHKAMVVLAFSFHFRLELPFVGKFGPRNHYFQFKLKFGTHSNLSTQKSMAMFVFFCFRPEILVLGKFSPKI